MEIVTMTQEDKKTAIWTTGVTAGLVLVVVALWFAGLLE